MAIEKRDGKFLVRLFNPTIGKKESWTCKLISDARILQRQKKSEYSKFKLGDRLGIRQKCKLTFGELVEKYIYFHTNIHNPTPEQRNEILLSRVKIPSPKKSFGKEFNLLNHLTEYFGGMVAENITPAMIERYRSLRKEKISPRTKRHYTTASINLELNCMSAVYSWSIRKEKYLAVNPLHEVQREKTHNERDRVLTDDEFKRLLNCCAPHLKPIILTAYYTGMRYSEIVNLTWDRVNLDQGYIYLRPEDTKTNTERIIPMNTILGRVFNDLTKSKGEIGRREGDKSEINRSYFRDKSEHFVPQSVFLHHGKNLVSVKTAFKAACRRAGLKDFRFHDLRHCFVTRTVSEEGKPIPMIMKITGHKTNSAFLRYNNPKLEQLRAVVEPGKFTPLTTKVTTLENGQNDTLIS